MSFFLSELYSPKPSWLALSEDQRRQFFADVGAALSSLFELGVEVIAMGETDFKKTHAAPHTFFALWKFPDEAALDALLDGITASSWHDYFDTLNAAGVGNDFSTHLTQLVKV